MTKRRETFTHHACRDVGFFCDLGRCTKAGARTSQCHFFARHAALVRRLCYKTAPCYRREYGKNRKIKSPAELGAAGAWSRRNKEGFLSPSNAPGHTTGRTRGEGPKETRKSEAACVHGSGAGAPCDSSTRSRTCAAIDTKKAPMSSFVFPTGA